MTEDIAETERRCNLASAFWWSVVSSITAIAYRERGERDLSTIWYKILTGEQTDRFKEGLAKIGIREDEPPAVKAAQYHYFSNSIGGLNMQYIEESSKKVWIRYIGPNGTYPGVAMLAMPASQRRTVFSSWHPRNGELMGCPRLGYVATKFSSEGDPYDEGYFFEYDRDLRPEERIQFETVHSTPEFDPAKAPKLDPDNWPRARLLKGMRNFPRDYVAKTTEVLETLYGEQKTTSIIATAMRCMGVQLTNDLASQLKIPARDFRSLCAFHTGILEACYEDFEVINQTDRLIEIRRNSCLPFHGYVPESRRAAFFEFQQSATRMFSGCIRASRQTEEGSEHHAEIWRFEDTGTWLW
jgi:hypothetical protein